MLNTVLVSKNFCQMETVLVHSSRSQRPAESSPKPTPKAIDHKTIKLIKPKAINHKTIKPKQDRGPGDQAKLQSPSV